VLSGRDPVRRVPVRDFTPDRHEPLGYAWFEEAPRLAVLSTAGGARKDWMHAGQALQRVLLTATLRGIAIAPLTQPLETADAWLVHNPRAGVEQPQMILRLGYGLPVPASPRRPVSNVLDEPQWLTGLVGEALAWATSEDVRHQTIRLPILLMAP
jgi:hypothetical protein